MTVDIFFLTDDGTMHEFGGAAISARNFRGDRPVEAANLIALGFIGVPRSWYRLRGKAGWLTLGIGDRPIFSARAKVARYEAAWSGPASFKVHRGVPAIGFRATAPDPTG